MTAHLLKPAHRSPTGSRCGVALPRLQSTGLSVSHTRASRAHTLVPGAPVHQCKMQSHPSTVYLCIIHGTADRMAAQHVRPSSSMSSGKHDELIVAYEALQLQELAPQEIVGLAHLGLVTRLGVVVHAREALVEAA